MMIDFDNFFGTRRMPRVPSRLVRYGIIYGDTAKAALQDFEPQFDAKMKRQAQLMVEKLQAFIECCEAYEEATVDGQAEQADSKTEAKAKRPKSAKKAG